MDAFWRLHSSRAIAHGQRIGVVGTRKAPLRSARVRGWLSAAVGLVLLLSVGVGVSLGGEAEAIASTSSRLSWLLADVAETTDVGLVVADVRSGEHWFSRAAHQPLKPASVMKLFVTAAALERWGPEFVYRTPAYYADGELRVVGSGSPGLGDERIARRYGRERNAALEAWARTLRERGVTELDKIVLDDGVFDQQWRHPDWPDDQASAWYQAPVGGLNFNDNCVDARVELKRGDIRLVLEPALPEVFARCELRVGKRHRPIVRRDPDSDIFEFAGTVRRDADLGPTSVRRPTVFFGYALKQALAAEGIHVRGEVVRRDLPVEAGARGALLGEAQTRMRDVLWRCNTFSQNLFAECLLKSLPAYDADGERTGAVGSWARGTAELERVLARLGVDMDGAVLRDGSGLSHENRVTAAQVVMLLERMWVHRHAAPFKRSLARSGEEGSMRRRYNAASLRGHLVGKTGTLRGVRTLAGYVEREDGVTLAFALLINGRAERSLPTKVAEVLVGE